MNLFWRFNAEAGRGRRIFAALLLGATALFFSCARPAPGLAFDKDELDIELNLNTASIEELQRLPFIGAHRARAIVEYRRQHGPFTSIEQLLESETVGAETYKAIKPYLRLSTSPELTIGTNTAGARVLGTSQAHRRLINRPGETVLLTDKNYYDQLLAVIRQATSHIDIAMFIFKTTDSPDNRPARILNELAAARKRGVIVRVMLEKSGYDQDLNAENQRTATQLRRHDIEVGFDMPAKTSHTKLVVIDHRYVFIGSHNFTHAALALNHECSLLIDNPTLADELLAYMKTLNP